MNNCYYDFMYVRVSLLECKTRYVIIITCMLVSPEPGGSTSVWGHANCPLQLHQKEQELRR